MRRTHGVDFQRQNAPMSQRAARTPLPARWPPLALPASDTNRALVRHNKRMSEVGEREWRGETRISRNNSLRVGRATQVAPNAQPPGSLIASTPTDSHARLERRGQQADIRVISEWGTEVEGVITDRCKHVGISRTVNARRTFSRQKSRRNCRPTHRLRACRRPTVCGEAGGIRVGGARVEG